MDNSVERDKRIEEIRRMNSRLISSHHAQDFLLKELDRLQVERDKAISELKRFAARDPYATGSSARRVLSELGVPHDPLD